MTLKDYEKFAAMMAHLRKHFGRYERETAGKVVLYATDVEDAMMEIFLADNPKFSRERFMKAAKR